MFLHIPTKCISITDGLFFEAEFRGDGAHAGVLGFCGGIFTGCGEVSCGIVKIRVSNMGRSRSFCFFFGSRLDDATQFTLSEVSLSELLKQGQFANGEGANNFTSLFEE
jgi:F0F1-type ATP synthase alpha subunit